MRSDCLSEQVGRGQQPAPLPLRRLPLLPIATAAAASVAERLQVERGQQPAPLPLRRLPLLRSDCRSSEGSQLNATAAAAAVAERLQVKRLAVRPIPWHMSIHDRDYLWTAHGHSCLVIMAAVAPKSLLREVRSSPHCGSVTDRRQRQRQQQHQCTAPRTTWRAVGEQVAKFGELSYHCGGRARPVAAGRHIRFLGGPLSGYSACHVPPLAQLAWRAVVK